MASESPKAIVRSSRYVSCLDTICRICSDLYKMNDLSELSTLIFDAFILLLLESLHLLGHHRHIAHWKAEFNVAKTYGKPHCSPLFQNSYWLSPVSPERALDIVGIPPLKMKLQSEEQDHACGFVDRRLVTFSSEQLQNDQDLRAAFRHAYAEAASFDVLCRPLYHFQATLFPAIRYSSSTVESQSSGIFPDLPTPTRTPSPQYANTSLDLAIHIGPGHQTRSYGPRASASLESVRQATAAAIQSNQILQSKISLLKKSRSFSPKDLTDSLTASDFQSSPSSPENSTTYSLQDSHVNI